MRIHVRFESLKREDVSGVSTEENRALFRSGQRRADLFSDHLLPILYSS